MRFNMIERKVSAEARGVSPALRARTSPAA